MHIDDISKPLSINNIIPIYIYLRNLFLFSYAVEKGKIYYLYRLYTQTQHLEINCLKNIFLKFYIFFLNKTIISFF